MSNINENSINNNQKNNINTNNNNSNIIFSFNPNSEINQEYDEEEDDLNESINKLSINNSNNLNNNLNNIKNNNNSKNIFESNKSNLFSSKSTESSSLINFQLSQNAARIYENIYIKNNINNSIIISDDEELNREIYTKIIEDFYLDNKNNNNKSINKICFLVIESKKIEKLHEKLTETFGQHKKVMILQKGKGKKMKNDYNKFIEFIQNSDIFIAIPDVFYKLLSIGFIKIEQFSILFIDNCHLCEGNHPYNIIMQEFYYYYFYRKNILKINNNYELPYIFGFSDSPFFDKRIISNDNKCKQFLTNISENLNCQMIISPKLFNNNSIINENNDIQYIQVENNLKDNNNYENFKILYTILEHYFIKKMLQLSLKDFLSQNENNSFDKQKINNIGECYLKFAKKKFYTVDFSEYIVIESNEKQFNFLSQSSYIFRIFEEIQKFLIISLQNIDVQGIVDILNKYLQLYQDYLNQIKIENKKVSNQLNHLIGIINDTIKAFEHLFKQNFIYNNYRLNKFMSNLNNIYTNNNNSKIIIFVPSRKLAYILNEYLKKNNKYKSEYIAGVNTKKEENVFLSLSPKITYNIINERNKKFNEGEINILICTPSVSDILQIKKCDYILIYSELSNSNSDYIRIKNMANSCKSKLVIFTLNKSNIENSFMQKIVEHDNKLMIFFEKNEIVRDFRGQNYFNEKMENISKQIYYIIEETQAKVSIRNSTMLYNDINNWFLQQNIKLIINKFIDEIYIDKIKKYKCKFELNQMFGGTKIFSHIFGDKQTSEAECYLLLISFLHKNGIIDNNLKIIDKFK